MTFTFIDNQNSITVIADNFQRVFPKNYLYVESDELSNILKIKSTEHRVLYVLNFGTDITIPSYPTKQDLINGLNFFFEIDGGGSGDGDMLKSVYDTDNDGIVDASESIFGITTPNQYYGSNALNSKGFFPLPNPIPAGQSISDNIIVKGNSSLTAFANLIYFIHNGYVFSNVRVLLYNQAGSLFTIEVFDITNNSVVAALVGFSFTSLTILTLPIINAPVATQAVYTLRVKRDIEPSKTVFVESLLIY